MNLAATTVIRRLHRRAERISEHRMGTYQLINNDGLATTSIAGLDLASAVAATRGGTVDGK